eukprot:Gb_19506 [translate_table: standard]
MRDFIKGQSLILWEGGVLLKGNLRGEAAKSYVKLTSRLQDRLGDQYKLFLLVSPEDDRPVAVVVPKESLQSEPTVLLEIAMKGDIFSVNGDVRLHEMWDCLCFLCISLDTNQEHMMQGQFVPEWFAASAFGLVTLLTILLRNVPVLQLNFLYASFSFSAILCTSRVTLQYLIPLE